MEILVRNLPDQITERQVEQFFRPYLTRLSIVTFDCRKRKNQGVATITIADASKAETFLLQHGQTKPGREGHATVKHKLFHLKKPINCFRSDNPPDKFLLQSLEQDEKRKPHASESRKTKEGSRKSRGLQKKFDIVSLDCGHWDYNEGRLVFMSSFREQRKGAMTFLKRFLRVDLDSTSANLPRHRLDIPYDIVQSITAGSPADPAVTISLFESPRLFEELTNPAEDVTLSAMKILTIRNQPNRKQQQAVKRKRISAISKSHEIIVSSCLCYRLVLQNSTEIRNIQALKEITEIPQSIYWDTHCVLMHNFPARMTLLNGALAGQALDSLSFEVKFQFQKLVQNGHLPPATVIKLLKQVSFKLKEVDEATLVASVRKLSHQIPFAGPHTDPVELSVQNLTSRLLENKELVDRESLYSAGLVKQHEHLALIHKAIVTPTGTYLLGPDLEIKNRVLRKYSAFSNYFLQVSFQDENGEPLRYDRQASNEDIYHQRFKKVLEGVILIAGRGYEFLGFSHSSLRSQACWFMAPFTLGGELLHARLVIKRLGDFSGIRSPAKCAARIGQAFSQTFSSITLAKESIHIIDDVERNGRVFSDGVGTCSEMVMKKIWKEYSQSRDLEPTVFQIRFAGAKGMISLDNKLDGEALCLRPSMIKFKTVESNIEICGAGLRPLPMYLNRPLIKILEDLGVRDEAFLKLQAKAVESLRMTTESPVNAANFLQRNFIGKAAKLPWLIRKLLDIGILFNDDQFLRNSLELAILIQLRELKHRSRIYVEEGLTLYGIMDETGFLQENEVYCTVENDKGPLILTGSVVVTRSPALHPGDVRCATAIDAPRDSSLRALRNCLVFSSKGERDLPSKLSGGDLDGDLYNVIYHESLYPSIIAEPADYPIQQPIDIAREVVRSDMTDFFIQFMENDQLGRIATLHLNLADQRPDGTFDPDCIRIAGLHSTAVDFSKSGIPADLSQLPRHSNVRPDFQAPGPHVLIQKNIDLKDDSSDDEFSDDGDDDNNDISPRIRYYQSPKVLGKLYRAIDEHKIFEQIQHHSRQFGSSAMGGDTLHQVWEYVQKATALIQYSHYTAFARDVKEAYEENLVDTMFTFSTHPNYALSEIEVFSGCIMGKTGAQSKRQREFSSSMKEKQERDVAYTVSCIIQGEENDNRAEALERSIACLEVATNTVRVRRKVGRLYSFGWVAAAVCLREVDRFQGN